MKYSRQCQCSPRCGHLARGSEALQPADRLAQLASISVEAFDSAGHRRVVPLLALLIDCAEAYDSDGLIFDADCGIHGERVVSNSECSCRGERTTAAEFIQALILDVRSAGRTSDFVGRPASRRHHGEKLTLVSTG